MNESNEFEQKSLRKKNIWFAIILGLIALTVTLMPFLYLNSAVVNG